MERAYPFPLALSISKISKTVCYNNNISSALSLCWWLCVSAFCVPVCKAKRKTTFFFPPISYTSLLMSFGFGLNAFMSWYDPIMLKPEKIPEFSYWIIKGGMKSGVCVGSALLYNFPFSKHSQFDIYLHIYVRRYAPVHTYMYLYPCM
jgi:hypothetical protein